MHPLEKAGHVIDPIWSAQEIRQLCAVSHPPRSNRWSRAVVERVEPLADTYKDLIQCTLVWDANNDVAAAIWAGNIHYAEAHKQSDGYYADPQSLEIALIERLTSPASITNQMPKTTLCDAVYPIVQASPIAQMRPSTWADPYRAKPYISSVIEQYTLGKHIR